MSTAPVMLDLLAHGVLAWGAAPIVAYVLVSTHLTIVAVTVYLHRCQAHRALTLHPAVSHLFRFWLWMTTGMSTRAWVAIHRKHHAFCERPGDPHSPQLVGIRTVLLRGSELYRSEARDAATLRRYGRGTPDDWLERAVYGVLPWQGVGVLLVLDVVLFGAIGLTVWAVQMLWIPVLAAGVVNGLGHYWGYRSFDDPSAAANLIPWGILIGGEELHGNHHTFPASARLSARWFECDIGWGYICLLAAARLADVHHVAPRAPMRRRHFAEMSSATVAGLIVHRHHVMRAYGAVQVQVFRAALKAAALRPAWAQRRAAEHVLRRRPDLMSAPQKEALAALAADHATVERTLVLGGQLRSIWQDRQCSPADSLSRLRHWCHEANAAGIPALGAFARRIPMYSVTNTSAVAAA